MLSNNFLHRDNLIQPAIVTPIQSECAIQTQISFG